MSVITNIDILIRNINIIFHHLRAKDSTHHHWSVHHGNPEEEPPLGFVWRGSLLSHTLGILRVLGERSARQVPGGEWQWDSDPGQWWLRTTELDQHQQRNPQWPFRRLRRGEKDPLFRLTFSKSLDLSPGPSWENSSQFDVGRFSSKYSRYFAARYNGGVFSRTTWPRGTRPWAGTGPGCWRRRRRSDVTTTRTTVGSAPGCRPSTTRRFPGREQPVETWWGEWTCPVTAEIWFIFHHFQTPKNVVSSSGSRERQSITRTQRQPFLVAIKIVSWQWHWRWQQSVSQSCPP